MFLINGITREITSDAPKEDFLFGVTSDEKANIKYFKGPRYTKNSVDLASASIRINYINGGAETDQYIVTDLEADEEYITFSWTFHRNVTKYKGAVQFIVCAVKCDADGSITNEWNTTSAKGTVQQGIEVDGSEYEEETADAIESILLAAQNRINAMVVDDTLSQAGVAADAAATGAAIESLTKELEENINQLSEEIAKLTGADPEIISQAVSEWLDANPDVTTTVGDGTITEAKLDEELKKKIDSGVIDIVYPTQLTTYNSKLTEYLQKLADNSDTINTSNEYLAHSVLVSSVGRTVVFAFVENDTSGAKEDDCSLSTNVHCKGRILIDKSPIAGAYQNNFIGDSGIFYLFGNGETVYDADGGTVGTVVASTGAIVTSVDENNYHINSRVRLNDGRVIHAHRLLTVSYTVTNSGNTITVSYKLGEIKNTTLTVDGVTGDNDLSRVSGDYSGIVYSGCGFQYNVDDGKAYTARVISGKGVAICSTTDFIDFQFVAFYEFSNAYIEASLFFDVAYIGNEAYNRRCVYVACRQPYGVNYTRIAKLDHVNNYEVLDEVDIPSATSRPMWSSSKYKGSSFLDYNCFLLLGDYNRDYMSIYKIVDRDIRNLKPVAKIKGKCSNYPAIAERRNSVTTASYGDVIIAGTNGNHTNFGGISFIACKLADGLEDFSDSESYTKDEIDAMFGSYVSDVALLVGGDA